jgi:hypothetical protein
VCERQRLGERRERRTGQLGGGRAHTRCWGRRRKPPQRDRESGAGGLTREVETPQPSNSPHGPYDIESGPGGLTREVETPLPSNSPHGPYDIESGAGGLTREVETPLPSNSPHGPYDIESGAGGLTREVETPLRSNHAPARCDQYTLFQLNTIPCYATQCSGRLGVFTLRLYTPGYAEARLCFGMPPAAATQLLSLSLSEGRGCVCGRRWGRFWWR